MSNFHASSFRDDGYRDAIAGARPSPPSLPVFAAADAERIAP